MEEYMNLSSPLNENGVFVGDGKNNITNPSVQNLPTMYLSELRKQFEGFDLPQSNDNSNNLSNQSIDTSKYQSDMRLSFPQLLKEEGINIRVTSELRKNAKTKSGHKSHHSYINEWGFSAACDIVPTDGNFDKLKKDIYDNPRIVAWLINHNIGILEETTQDVISKTGATGKHFHVGPDKWAIKMSSKYIDYSTKNILANNFSKNKKSLSEVGWNINRPFQNNNAWKVSLNTKVSLTKEDLWGKDTGNSQNVHRLDLLGTQTRLGSNLARKHNNPCNISPRKGDFGYVGSSYAADGQKHAGYNNIVNGLASTMKLYQERYNNKSVRSVNNGFQGYLSTARKEYKEQDWKALENLRLIWITHVSDNLGISPFMKLNLNDKETMFSFIAAVAKQESGSTLSRKDMEAAWNVFKGGR